MLRRCLMVIVILFVLGFLSCPEIDLYLTLFTFTFSTWLDWWGDIACPFRYVTPSKSNCDQDEMRHWIHFWQLRTTISMALQKRVIGDSVLNSYAMFFPVVQPWNAPIILHIQCFGRWWSSILTTLRRHCPLSKMAGVTLETLATLTRSSLFYFFSFTCFLLVLT